MSSARTVIVLLNWRGATDTIECIESLLLLDDQEFSIVVCDNDSGDGSYEKIREWLVERGDVSFAEAEPGSRWLAPSKIVLIQTGANLGFAGGCNVGVRHALSNASVEYVWLLNNDTTVEPDSLGHQIDRMQKDPKIGTLGSKLVFFDAPDVIQCRGGYDFNLWTGRVLPIEIDDTISPRQEVSAIEHRLRYISGASMLVRRSMFEDIGLLNEQYFLYFEEIDWATRGAVTYRLGYCPESKVFHKEGRSIGSAKNLNQRSRYSEQMLSRNRVLFMKTYFRLRLPICIAWMTAVVLQRLLRGDRAMAEAMATGAWEGLRARPAAAPRIS